MKNKLKIKETEKPDKGPCEHDTTHMVDLLAGEISDKDRDTLSNQLNSCKECQDQLAELSQTWQLTAEILKGDTEFGVQSSEFQVEESPFLGKASRVPSWRNLWKSIPAG